MLRHLIPVVILPVVLSVAQQPEAPPSFKTQTELVLVSAIVQDKHGEHVSGLTKENFKLLENGKPQEIRIFDEVKTTAGSVSAAAPSAPNEFSNRATAETSKPHRLTIIAFDLLNMPTLKQADARKALWDLLAEAANSMEPTAVYTIGTSGVQVVSDFTTDPHTLAEALKHLKSGRKVVADLKLEATPHEDVESDQYTADSRIQLSGSGGAGRMTAILQQMETLQKEIELNTTSQLRRYVVLDTLSGLRQIAQACALIPGRKSLVWVTGGIPFDVSPTDMSIMGSPFPGGRRDWTDVYAEYLRTWRALNDAQVVLYPVDVRGMTSPTLVDPSIMNQGERLDGRAGAYQDRQSTSADYAFADATGGRAFYGSSDLKKGFEEAVRDSDNYYVLGYYVPADSKAKSGWRTISVKSRAGLEIRARSGYFYNPSHADLQMTRQRDLDGALYSPIDLTAVTFTARWKQVIAEQPTGARHVGFELVLPASFAAIDEADNNHMAIDILALAKTPDGKVVGKATARTIDGHLNATQLRQVRERGLTYANALDLPPGDYVVRFVVRDGLNGRIGSLTAPLKVSVSTP
ncbi:MAG: VWA domain-containing protein [Terriglobales bacterium]